MSNSRSPRAVRSTTIGTSCMSMGATLAINGRHPLRVVAIAARRRDRGGDPLGLLAAQPHLGGAEVVLQVGAPLGAGDRDDVLPTREHPRERQLRRSDALLG